MSRRESFYCDVDNCGNFVDIEKSRRVLPVSIDMEEIGEKYKTNISPIVMETLELCDSCWNKLLEVYPLTRGKGKQTYELNFVGKDGDIDEFSLADIIRKSYLKHGKDSWVSVAKDLKLNLKECKKDE